MAWMIIAAIAILILGLLLVGAGQVMRRRRGLGKGGTVSLDRVTLTSRRYGLTGRPDRLIRSQGTVIPEEWKSARTLRPWHRIQIGVYFLLIEDQLGKRPPYGFIVCGDGTRHRVDNDQGLRASVLELADQLRRAKAGVETPIAVHPKPGHCRPCGMAGHCRQARL